MMIIAIKTVETVIHEVLVEVPDNYNINDTEGNFELLSYIEAENINWTTYGGAKDYLFDSVVTDLHPDAVYNENGQLENMQ